MRLRICSYIKENERIISTSLTRVKSGRLVERVINYVNTFANVKCINTYMRLVRERIIKGSDYRIEPIEEGEIEERKKIEIEQQIAKIRAKDIYKGRVVHTDEEYLSILQSRYKKFLENDLTEEAKEVIQKIELNMKRKMSKIEYY